MGVSYDEGEEAMLAASKVSRDARRVLFELFVDADDVVNRRLTVNALQLGVRKMRFTKVGRGGGHCGGC